jgi:hypothetical protein
MSLIDVQKLKESILDIIRNNKYTFHDLGKLLLPITAYNQNPLFMSNIRQVVYVVTEDRNGNEKFDVNDLKILKEDINAITSIVCGLLLVLGAVPDIKLKYKNGITEEILFKMLAYIFVVIVPKETGYEWTHNEKGEVVDIVVTIYKKIIYTNITKDLVDKVSTWFKFKKNGCACIGVDDYNDFKQNVAEKYLPKIGTSIMTNIEKNKGNTRLRVEVEELRTKLEWEKKKNNALKV